MRRASQAIQTTIIVVLTTILFLGGAFGDEWPRWRGPEADGVWREDGIIEQFAGPEITPRWRVEISGGYAGPTVANGCVYVMDRITEPTSQERVLCFAWDSGRLLWSYAYECDYGKMTFPTGPRASVTVTGGRAYSLGTMGHMRCLDALTGALIWERDLGEDYKIRIPTWGIAASPVVEGDIVVAHIGGSDGACVVGLDAATGEDRWRALDDPASYSTPIVIERAGKRILICWTGRRVVALDPASGEVHWAQDFPLDRIAAAISAPVIEGNRLFVASFFGGSLMLELSDDGLSAKRLWARAGKNERDTDALHCLMSTPVFENGTIYGIDGYGTLRALNAETGDRFWSTSAVVVEDRWANAHLVRHEDETWLFNEQGELIIAKLSPEGYEEISRAKLIEPTLAQFARKGAGVAWAHPAFAYRHVFIRSDNELICADLGVQ